jgi:hypothetical protein
MDFDKARNKMQGIVESDLAAICKKVADNSDLPDHLRAKSRDLVQEFEAYSKNAAKDDSIRPEIKREVGEALLVKMARFLPELTEDHAWYSGDTKM